MKVLNVKLRVKWPAMSLLLVGLALAAPGLAFAADDPAAERLGKSITFQTLSHQDPAQFDPAPFKALQEFLKTSYPLIHQRLAREEVGLSLLYTWKGSDPSLKPILMLAHQDVVPIAPGTLQNWTCPPFEGRIQDGFVWGRGTMDCKGLMMAELESVENLLALGYQPRRTVYLAFGHDEEVGGTGAIAIAQLLKSRGVTAELVIDESGMLLDGKVLGIAKPVAVIGIAEKGYLSLELTARAKGGHSSTPPTESAIAILSSAITKIQRHQFPAHLNGGVTSMTFKALGPEMPGVLGFAVKNQWLFGGLIQSILEKQAATAAMIRTTTAVTIINAGSKENVLPQEARAVVNFRLLPGDNIAYVTETIKKVVNDPRVEVKPIGEPREASQVSKTDSPGWKLVTGTIKQMFPEAAIAPYLCLGGTDSRHYELISDSVYRFAPLRATAEDQERAHGTNERIGVENYHEMIRFYEELVKNADQQ